MAHPLWLCALCIFFQLHRFSFLHMRSCFVDETAPLWSILCSLFPRLNGILKSFNGALRVCFFSFLSGRLGSAFSSVFLHRNLFLEVAHQLFLSHGLSVSAVLPLRLYACFASMSSSGPLYLVSRLIIRCLILYFLNKK